jgi:hypothetical protein
VSAASKWTIAVVATWLVATALWLTPGLPRPDGVGYFVYLPSTWLDRDLLFFDEWAQMRLIRPNEILFKDPTPTQHLGNHWTAGASVAWYPFYLAGNALARMQGEQGGFTVWHIAAIAFASALAALFTLLAGMRLGQHFFSPGISACAAIAVFLGSPLAFYATRHATMSHAVSAAACAAVVLLSLRLRDGLTTSRLVAVGMAIGFACTVRPQNVVIGFVPLLLASVLRKSHFLFAGALLAALPQLIVSQLIYGGPLVFVNIGGRAHSWQMFATFRGFETLFSWYHGFATWTPVLVLAVIGFAFLFRHDRGLARAAIVTFVAQWLLLAILERWFWGGASFGQRRFDSCTIFFILGLAAFLDRLPKWLGATMTIAATAWTMLLFIAATRLNLNRFQPPGELLEAFAAALPDPAWRTFLGFTPPQMRLPVVVTSLAVLATAAAIFFVARRHAAILTAIYFAAISAFYLWCGLHPKHDALSRDLNARWQRGELPSAAERDFRGLLKDEAIYHHRHAERRRPRRLMRRRPRRRP